MTIHQRAAAGIAAMSWVAAACGASGQQPAPSGTTAPQREVTAPRAVVCLATVRDVVRLYRFHQAGNDGGARQEWRLTMTEPASTHAPLVVPLDGAAPVVSDDSARLVYRSRNGELVVGLDSSGAVASLDVAVDHARAASADTGLTAAIDRLDTQGTVRLPPCRIESS